MKTKRILDNPSLTHLSSYLIDNCPLTSSSITHSTDSFYGILCSGLTDKTILSFISSNSSFTECVRKQIPFYHFLFNNIIHCRDQTFSSDIRCKHTGSPISDSSGIHTFTNDDFKDCYSSNDHGGAIKCTGSNTELIVTGCTFTDCHVSKPSSYRGGGIYAESIKSVTPQSCYFTSCSGFWGGGFYINEIGSTPSLSGCIFVSCKGHYLGGEAFVGQCTKTSSFIVCNDCIFIKGNNVSSSTYLRGGGFYLDIYESTHANAISNNLFTGNSVNNRGGGLAIYEESKGLDYSVYFCFFSDNSATSGGSDVFLTSITFNSFIHSFTTSDALDRLYVDILVTETDTSVEETHTPNWLPQGTFLFMILFCFPSTDSHSA